MRNIGSRFGEKQHMRICKRAVSRTNPKGCNRLIEKTTHREVSPDRKGFHFTSRPLKAVSRGTGRMCFKPIDFVQRWLDGESEISETAIRKQRLHRVLR